MLNGNVLSLFDGLGGSRLALQSLGVECNYYASEVDEHCVKLTTERFPDIIHLGDVRNVSKLDNVHLLVGGSPCQDLSRMNTERAGLEGKKSSLFWEYVRLFNECKPEYFLLENVFMQKKNRDIISKELGVEPLLINSSLFTAQNRSRYYWTNIPVDEITDAQVFIQHILEKGDPSNNPFCYSEGRSEEAKQLRREYKKLHGIDYTPRGIKQLYPRKDGKVSCVITSLTKDHTIFDGVAERKITPLECERLQGIPDNYTAGFKHTARIKMIGNGFTIPVIAHLIKNAF